MILATKRSIKQLEKIFKVLGEYGGTIETNNPGTWWKLDLEVDSVENYNKRIMIGVCSSVNSDLIFDPLFRLNLHMDTDNKIDGVEILEYESTSILGTVWIDSNNDIYGFGKVEKGKGALHSKFGEFMTNITEIGPYLTDPKKIKKYTKTLADEERWKLFMEDFMFEEDEKEFILFEMFGIDPNVPDAASDLEEAIDCYWS